MMISVAAQCKDCGRWSVDPEYRDMLIQVTISKDSPTPIAFARCINQALCAANRDPWPDRGAATMGM